MGTEWSDSQRWTRPVWDRKDFSFDKCTTEEILLLTSQLVRVNHRLVNIEKEHWAQLLCNFQFGDWSYVWAMIYVLQQAEDNSDDTSNWSIRDCPGFFPTMRNIYVIALCMGCLEVLMFSGVWRVRSKLNSRASPLCNSSQSGKRSFWTPERLWN